MKFRELFESDFIDIAQGTEDEMHNAVIFVRRVDRSLNAWYEQVPGGSQFQLWIDKNDYAKNKKEIQKVLKKMWGK